MAKNPCALCGVQLGLFEKKELVCCGETQIFCFCCYDEMEPLDHIQRTRVLLKEGRAAVNPEAMQKVLDRIDAKEEEKRKAEESKRQAARTDLNCLRCGISMHSLGEHYIKLGRYNYGTSYPKDSFYNAGSLKVRILQCAQCGKTEFFSSGDIVDNVDLSTPEENYVTCPKCGARHDPKIGCHRCAMNAAMDRTSTAPKAAKKPAEKPPWER